MGCLNIYKQLNSHQGALDQAEKKEREFVLLLLIMTIF